MQEYFGVNLEFDHYKFYQKIEKAISGEQSAYVCVVDANVLTIANRDDNYRKILNQSLVNTCDGSSIAFLLSKIHNENFTALNGPTIFEKLIEEDKKQVLLGGDKQSAESIKNKLQEEKTANSTLHLIPLPFSEVDDFNYEQIARELNELKPDIIWVSLGAPKQERFMHNLLPYLSSGVMFGIGAAFNFYIGQIKMPTYTIGGVGTLWLSRIFTEPKKQIKRMVPYVLSIPKLYYSQKKKVTQSNNLN
jgi:N-acetylglucosaminyldiphosphoundecaprenol N-acetyl-beta-D-mannosaminyltransferase